MRAAVPKGLLPSLRPTFRNESVKQRRFCLWNHFVRILRRWPSRRTYMHLGKPKTLYWHLSHYCGTRRSYRAPDGENKTQSFGVATVGHIVKPSKDRQSLSTETICQLSGSQVAIRDIGNSYSDGILEDSLFYPRMPL